MKILFIAPIPPPITGHSLVSEVFLHALQKDHEVALVNLSKNSFKEGINSFKRILEVGDIIKKVWQKKAGADVVYFTISESLAGNMKDLFIYLVCFNKLSKFYIHLHGGSIKRLLWEKHPFLYKINNFFIRRLRGVIISGKSHIPIFEDAIAADRIHLVPNFAQDYLFIDPKKIDEKFENTNPLRILYMSNLVPKKGYMELADAFTGLDDAIKKTIRIDYAGSFESDIEKNAFLDKISAIPQITYHGIVDQDVKQDLFFKAHVFCLPTSYLEGQPISILEAYASGCVVVTTGQSGIRDIFTDQVNGYEIAVNSLDSIRSVVTAIAGNSAAVKEIAVRNRETAGQKYLLATYNISLTRIITTDTNK